MAYKFASVLPNGEILQIGEVSTYEDIAIQVYGDGTIPMEVGERVDESYYFNGTDFVKMPEKPTEHHIWDGEEWIDYRTSLDLRAEMNRRRAVAQLDKSDLVIRLVLTKVLSEDEADEAAGGIIPASMQPMLAQLPPDAQMAARIKWKADVTISRTHPVIVAAAYALGIADEELDEIFGIEPLE